MKPRRIVAVGKTADPAAFRRLCVETLNRQQIDAAKAQPPSGGCVLKLRLRRACTGLLIQPPSGGCVLKQVMSRPDKEADSQPPSGGCVLKQQKAA